MKICLAVASPEGLASRVDAIRPDVRHLVIYDREVRSHIEIDLASAAAQSAAASDFDALVCATITRPLFRALRQQGKDVYLTQAQTVEQALAELERGEMLLIPDEAGGCGGGCQGHGHARGHAHGEGGCGCHGHAHRDGDEHAHGGCQCGSSESGAKGGCHGEGGGCGGGGCGGHGHEHGHGHDHAAGGGCCSGAHAQEGAQARARGENLRIAVTSQNRKTVTEHAGKCRKFWVYETRSGRVTGKSLLELPIEQSLHESPPGVPHPLDGIDVLITAGIGDGLKQRLSSRGIDTRVTSEADPDAAVEALFAAA